jgi:hypothetical protein
MRGWASWASHDRCALFAALHAMALVHLNHD